MEQRAADAATTLRGRSAARVDRAEDHPRAFRRHAGHPQGESGQYIAQATRSQSAIDESDLPRFHPAAAAHDQWWKARSSRRPSTRCPAADSRAGSLRSKPLIDAQTAVQGAGDRSQRRQLTASGTFAKVGFDLGSEQAGGGDSADCGQLQPYGNASMSFAKFVRRKRGRGGKR